MVRCLRLDEYEENDYEGDFLKDVGEDVRKKCIEEFIDATGENNGV